jgi:hypothetical protein
MCSRSRAGRERARRDRSPEAGWAEFRPQLLRGNPYARRHEGDTAAPHLPPPRGMPLHTRASRTSRRPCGRPFVPGLLPGVLSPRSLFPAFRNCYPSSHRLALNREPRPTFFTASASLASAASSPGGLVYMKETLWTSLEERVPEVVGKARRRRAAEATRTGGLAGGHQPHQP